MPGRRGLLKENENTNNANTTDPYTSARHVLPGIDAKDIVTERPPGFRRPVGTGSALKPSPGQPAAQNLTSTSQPNLSLRTRRQSSLPQTTLNSGPPAQAMANRQPRKSVGPGILTHMMETRKTSQPTPTTTDMRPPIPRTNSLSMARRPNLQPFGIRGKRPPPNKRTSRHNSVTGEQGEELTASSSRPGTKHAQLESLSQRCSEPREHSIIVGP